ncbi:FecR family protein [Pedobacter duraquae]|uniref:FecR family protein n=2 Tax=Pedobacter duraquae TaxID=425511 RepID=A0A4V3C457_9SPHI|nr:FecR family protein [Pedobacter duraquae]
MHIHRITELLRHSREQEMTDQDKTELDNWFHQLKGARPDLENWVAEAGSEELLAEELLTRFNQKRVKKHRSKKYLYYGIAASLILIFSVGLLVNKIDFNAKLPQAAVSVKNNSVPGKNRAILTLSNGTQIDLNGQSSGFVGEQSGARIYKTADGKLSYNQNVETNEKNLVYNTLTIPRGGQYQVELPDGTKVWLNSDTRLRYPTHFIGNERKVDLIGEAYFEVAHNKKMPFKVVTMNQEVTVLGTHFNVKGYGDDNGIATTLLEGSVNVQNRVSGTARKLVPGNQSTVLKNSNAIVVENVQLEQVMAWKNGYFIFENEDIRSIMKLIGRWYDVDVDYKLDQTSRFGGTFSKSADLNDLLKSFEAISNLKFIRQGRRVTVSN